MSGVAIEGKVILITGANRGIGKALASKALELGAKKVYATAREIQTR
jgi:NAD(P)-dependent dehydrogenase (short-subunit alcohol dehydrogenase family)